MNKQDTQDFYRLANTIREEISNLDYFEVERNLGKLSSIARSLHRISERVCSVEMSEAEEQRVEKREAMLEAKAKAIAEAMGCGLVLNGDPRGAPILLTVPSGKTNDWGRRGLVVPF